MLKNKLKTVGQGWETACDAACFPIKVLRQILQLVKFDYTPNKKKKTLARVTRNFILMYFLSQERKFYTWNFRSLVLLFPGTFAPHSELTLYSVRQKK